jgi:two-component system, LuxR family, response regulator FixJ
MLLTQNDDVARSSTTGSKAVRQAPSPQCDSRALALRVREKELDERMRLGGDRCAVFSSDHKPLTLRESDVLSQIMTGASNKQAALRLGISHRTIEVHRSRIMEKLGAKNLVDLVRIAIAENRAPATLS